jgi:hypothetical protein
MEDITMRAFGLIKMSGGVPAVDFSTYPVYGYVHIGSAGSGAYKYGAYIVSGTVAQLQALAGLADVYPICVLQKDDPDASLDAAITTARRNKLNTLIGEINTRFPAVDLPAIPAGATCRQVIRGLFRRFHLRWEEEEALDTVQDDQD